MEADVLNALGNKSAFMPGGQDRDGHLLIVVPVPYEPNLWTKKDFEKSIKYLLSILCNESMARGFSIIIESKKFPCRIAKSIIQHLRMLMGASPYKIIVIRPEPFWDTHRVENCGRGHKKGELITIPKSRLLKYFELSQLPDELGGSLVYNHDLWIQNRVRIENFKQLNERVLNDLENLQVVLSDDKPIRANETKQTLSIYATMYDEVQRTISNAIRTGNQLLIEIDDLISKKKCMTQDIIDASKIIKTHLNGIELKETCLAQAWIALEKNLDDISELANLEKGVTYVTNWILGRAEIMLNDQQKIGSDVVSCEALRREHDTLEMLCLETYGYYAELLHKIDQFLMEKVVVANDHADLVSQRDFMDFVCRSFANRLERRRNVLITSIRFYRLVSMYFDKTNEVFECLVLGSKVTDFHTAISDLQKLKDSQVTLGNVEKELKKEGEKLSDILSMPVKDALGRDTGADYSEDIAIIRDILDATIARKKIFLDSVELQKLTLKHVAHIQTCEQDAILAIKWIDDLYKVMIRTNSHVGCNINEIQMQKEELQTFQETAKGTYHYGCQLIEAALALRRSSKLATEFTENSQQKLNRVWNNLQTVSQEQMTRLRVSAVFHRSTEDHCNKLQDLRMAVVSITEISDSEHRQICLRKHLQTRESLLVEVGRMVRLGRLLKTRLREAFNLEGEKTIETSGTTTSRETISPTSGNLIACDAITTRLTQVAEIAESLDFTLKNVQTCFDIDLSDISCDDRSLDRLDIGTSTGSVDELNSSVKSSTEDESFVTASECTITPQSRSSYQTASEGCQSPWWNTEKSTYADSSDNDPEAPSMQLLSGVISSASVSFDDTEHSFLMSSSERSSLNDDTPTVLMTSKTLDNKDLSNTASVIKSNANSTQISEEITSWGTFCNVAMAKQSIKGCL